MKLALLPAQLTLPATAPADASVKLVVVTLAQSIGSENFTDTVVLTATFVASLAGMTLTTFGGVVSTHEIRLRVAAMIRAVRPRR